MRQPHKIRSTPPAPATAMVCLLAALGFFNPPHAKGAPELTLRDTEGRISLEGSAAEPLEIRVEVADLSTGVWRNLRAKPSVGKDDGTLYERTSLHTFPDGSQVELTFTIEVRNGEVEVKATWPTESTAPGFVRFDFWLPLSEAGNMTVTIKGKEWWRDGVLTSSGNVKLPEEIIGRRSSDNGEIFRITGEIENTSMVIEGEKSSKGDQGATIRLFAVPEPNSSTISDVQSMTWKIQFPSD